MKRFILSINSFNMFALALVCFEESNYLFPPLTLSTHNISFFFEQLNWQSFQSSNISVEFSTWITNFIENSFCGKYQIFFKFSSYQVLDVDHFLTIFKAPKGVIRSIRVNKKKRKLTERMRRFNTSRRHQRVIVLEVRFIFIVTEQSQWSAHQMSVITMVTTC